MHSYSSIDTTAAWKKLRLILSFWSDFDMTDAYLLKPIYNSSVPTQDVALKTFREHWIIETDAERGSRRQCWQRDMMIMMKGRYSIKTKKKSNIILLRYSILTFDFFSVYLIEFASNIPWYLLSSFSSRVLFLSWLGSSDFSVVSFFFLFHYKDSVLYIIK